MGSSKKDLIEVVRSDITKIEADAIVNAANSSLMGGGGVDGAIHHAGGASILEECKKIVARQGSCKTGEAVITTAGHLPAKFVIHTVGPVWTDGEHGEAELLSRCYKNSLALAEKNHCLSISFPAISTGRFGYPPELAADIAVRTILAYLESGSSIQKVILVSFDEQNYNLIEARLAIK